MAYDPSSPITCVSCAGGGGGAGRLLKGRKDYLNLEEEVSTAGSEWLRSVTDDIGLSHSFSDFFHEDLLDDLGLDDEALSPVARVGIAFSTMSIVQTPTVSGGRTDGGGGGSVTMEAIFDSDTAAGQVIYISGDGHVDLAQANAGSTTTASGIAIQDVASGQTGEYIPVGPVTCETWSLSPGSVYYLSPSVAGGMTTTYPDSSGQFVIILGAAATTTQLNLEIHWMMEQP